MITTGIPDTTVAVAAKGLTPLAKPEPKRVVIAGAGMAGLTAGHELARAGHDVQILEARPRPGGRIWTWRDFASRLYVEAGAAYIAEHHLLARQYAASLGVGLRPVLAEASEALLHLGGKTVTFADAYASPETFPVQLPGAESGKSPVKLWREAIHSVRAILDREGEDNGWKTIAATYVRLTLAEFLEQAGWSDAAISLFAMASQREIRLECPAVDQLRELVGHARSETFEVAGGMDQLTGTLFGRLADRVRFGARVTGVHTGRDEVAVSWTTASGQQATAHADYVIFAVPVPVLLGLHFYPALSRAKTQAMRAVHYPGAVTVAAQFGYRFWEDQPYKISGGTTCTDLSTRRITYPTHAPEGTGRGVLRMVHAWQPDTGVWAAMSDGQRVRQFAADITAIHPGTKSHLEHGRSHNWGADPYTGGHSALFPPADSDVQIAALASPEHRLLFAGEHTSPWHGTVEGAAESGVRAALHVHHAPA